jgi:hypothetical protein
VGFIEGLQQFSVLLAIWAAIVAAVTVAVRQVILKGVDTSFRQLELGLVRRSAFTERIHNQRFNLVIEISQKLERIRSDLERLVEGRLENEDVATKGEVRALTQIYEDLRVIRVILGPELADLLQSKAHEAAIVASQWEHLRQHQGDLKKFQVRWEEINDQIYVAVNKIFGFQTDILPTNGSGARQFLGPDSWRTIGRKLFGSRSRH